MEAVSGRSLRDGFVETFLSPSFLVAGALESIATEDATQKAVQTKKFM